MILRDTDEDPEEIATPTRTFSWREVTSGLPDDSREVDEREEARRLRDLRGRVKAARAAISATLGGEQVPRQDRTKAAQFYVRFGVTETQFRHGVHDVPGDEADNPVAQFSSPAGGMDELH